MKLIDTTIAVDYLRGRQAAVDLLEGPLGSEEPVAASELVRFELLAGAREGEIDSLGRFFSALGGLRSTPKSLERPGSSPGATDAATPGSTMSTISSGTAIVLDADLPTTNERHFPMLTGLRLPY